MANARADAAHLRSRPFPKGEAPRDRSRHGAREPGRVVEPRALRGGHGGIHARLQRPQPAPRADAPAADPLGHRSHGSIAGRLAPDKPAIVASADPHFLTQAIALWRTKFLRCTGKAKHAIRVVITTNEGQIETQDIAWVEREDLTPTTLRLTLAEGKTILKALQAVVGQQWHGNVYKALRAVQSVEMDLDAAVATSGHATARKLLRTAEEFHIHIKNNKNNGGLMPNYGERYRAGERISTGFMELTVNQVISKRFCKKQQVAWTPCGAHCLLQIRTRVLNRDREATFREWYTGFRAAPQPMAA
jgi:hypothetical protein